MAEAVDVEDHDKIIEFIMASEVKRLPDAALCSFAVANETVYSEQSTNQSNRNKSYKH